jgi:hypothetical protein
MQGTTRRWVDQLSWALYGVAVVSLIGLALLGQLPETAAGWLFPPVVWAGRGRAEVRSTRYAERDAALRAVGWRLLESWRPMLLRSVVLWGLWATSGGWGPAELRWLPWLLWLWRGLAAGWPGLAQGRLWWGIEYGLWQAQRGLLVGYLGVALSGPRSGAALLGCLMVGDCARAQGDALDDCAPAPWVCVVRQGDGSYQAELCGHFTLSVAGDQPFRMRLLVLLLSFLDVPGQTRGSRRTRDGRTPFVRQRQLAAWFEVPQPDISRWQRYWQAGAWADLLSLHSAEVLTAELRAHIVTVCATFPTWGVAQVYHYLRQQGLAVTLAQVHAAVEQSGWRHLQQTLAERYTLGENTVRLRESWLVGQLLAHIRELLARLEAGQAWPVEERQALADLTTLAQVAGASPPPPVKALPWQLRIQQVLFAQWQPLANGPVCCPFCGSNQVARKSAQPRLKKYYDAQGQLCEVAVYRYYCHNPQCATGSFTNLPPGLLPYSRYRTELHLLAVQMYAWGYSTYRRTGTALGVASLTAWRWVSAWGGALLPIAALFGVVKSSGVVGVDEKYVLVPKNDKPAGAMRRWMYVYLAVDVWTYDLLHIAIYPHKDDASAEAFLLALRTKGYHPQVIVTDLRQDYGPVIAQVFPHAVHHLCIFHALQDVQKHIKDVYGPDYADRHPPAERLKQDIYAIFAADTPALAAERYTTVLALRQDYIATRPEAAQIFDFLQRHWPKLANSIDSTTIPATNNAVELVIRRFDQHYQNFCGFESITDAQRYLAVFEKLYRFTPFSQDAQPRIRGKSPLQLAGYDVASLPMATLCAGLSIIWPMQTAEVDQVPNQLR